MNRLKIFIIITFTSLSDCLASAESIMSAADSLSLWESVQIAIDRKVAVESELVNGKTTIHTVKRGESWESIAELYGVSVENLRIVNPFIEECYSGIEISVPSNISKLQISHNKVTNNDSRYIAALETLKNGNYGKARKMYSDIIKKHDAHAVAYYSRGLCNFHLGKYSECYDDMSRVISLDSDGEIFEDARDIRKKAQKEIQRNAERKNQMWNGVLTALAGGMQMAAQYSEARMQAKAYNNPQTFSSASAGSHVIGGNWSPQLTAAGINPPVFMTEEYMRGQLEMINNQVAAQMKEQEESFKRNYRAIHPWADETSVNQAYYNYLADLNTTSVANGELNTQYEDNNNSGTKKSNNRYGDKDCHICHGSGKCPTCGGSKVVSNMGHTSECPNCLLINMKRTGKCSRCQGTGKVYGIL